MVFDVGRPLQPWELAKQLPEGLAFAKHMGGEAGEVMTQLMPLTHRLLEVFVLNRRC